MRELSKTAEVKMYKLYCVHFNGIKVLLDTLIRKIIIIFRKRTLKSFRKFSNSISGF